MAAYGNRQTPYNLMQYYEFCEAMPKHLRPQIELMPRQNVKRLTGQNHSFFLLFHVVVKIVCSFDFLLIILKFSLNGIWKRR